MRTEVEKTQLLQQPLWHHPRVHLLDDTWLLTIVAILVATALPWFASGFEVGSAPPHGGSSFWEGYTLPLPF